MGVAIRSRPDRRWFGVRGQAAVCQRDAVVIPDSASRPATSSAARAGSTRRTCCRAPMNDAILARANRYCGPGGMVPIGLSLDSRLAFDYPEDPGIYPESSSEPAGSDRSEESHQTAVSLGTTASADNGSLDSSIRGAG